VQTRIGPSLIKRDSRSAWLALIDSAKILTITGARSWLLPTKSYRVKRLLLHFTFYRTTGAVLYRSTYLFLYRLSTLQCFFWPQGLLHIIAKMSVQDVSVHVTYMSQQVTRHNMPKRQIKLKSACRYFFVAAKLARHLFEQLVLCQRMLP